jgi:hypothetical protein
MSPLMSPLMSTADVSVVHSERFRYRTTALRAPRWSHGDATTAAAGDVRRAAVALAWALFGPAHRAQAATGGFVAPLPAPLTVLSGFDPPAQPWLPGNRGVDLAATAGEPVVAAADGVVLYAGLLAGRGVVSIDHGGIRTTYEPVDPAVARGAPVRRGQVIGRVAAVADGCGPPGGCLHWGAIRGDAYLDPLSLLAAPQVRLLPIWLNGLPTVPPGSDSAAVVAPERAAVVTPQQAAAGRGDSSDVRTLETAAAMTAGTGVAVGAGAALARRKTARISTKT